MSLWEIIKLALKSLGRNKLRSFLTALGIIIGVTSVVAMVGLGQGAYYSVQENIASMGTNLIMVFPGTSHRRGFHGPRGSITTLTPEDSQAIVRECPSVALSTPVVRSGGQAVFGNRNWSSSVMGVNEAYLEISSRKIALGKFMNAAEARAGEKICILGKTVVTNLFGNLNPIGQTIRFKKLPLVVVGVLEERGETSMGSDQDDVIIVPFPAIQRRVLGIDYAHMLNVSARTPELVESAKDEISRLLTHRHRCVEGEEDFRIRTQEDIAEMAGSTLAIIAMLLGSIASVSLLVGGIGIMNIMLVSVTERTREIGIRMAIGAKTRDILIQFLIESVTLSCIGGAAGILGGIGLSKIISYFVDFPPLVSWPAIIISFVFSGSVGVFFGLYPAWKASKLDPIEAFRYE